MRKLRLAEDLLVPLDIVTQRTAILGRTGSGKSTTAGRIFEQVVKAKQQAVVLTPKDDWWGIRSSADGKSAGLPVTLFGGSRGDVPIEHTAGALVADTIVDERLSAVITLSEFETQAQENRFAADFAERFFWKCRKSRTPVLFFIDESDQFAPQHPERDEHRMLNRYQRICRRGRTYGIGVCLMTQRSAALHKGCLGQTEVMIAHQTTGPQDRKAIGLWTEGKGTDEEQERFMALLASLRVGQAIVWSPSWLNIFREVQILPKDTYDSSATPKVGVRRRAPKVLAPVDIERLRRHMAEAIQRMKAEDPGLLREEIARLKADLARAHAAKAKAAPPPVAAKAAAPPPRTVVKTEVRRVEVPVLGKGLELRLLRIAVDMEKAVERAAADSRRVEAAAGELVPDLRQLVLAVRKAGADAVVAQKRAAESANTARPPASGRPPAAARPSKPVDGAHKPPPESAAGNGAGLPLNGRQLDILRALALFRGMGRTDIPRKIVAAVAGVSHRSSGYEQNVGQARKAGCLEYGAGSTLLLTDEGLAQVGEEPPPVSTEEMLERCMKVLSGSQRDLLKALHDQHPGSLTREELAQRVGKSHTSSGFEANVGVLKAAGMAEYLPGKRVRRADWISVEAEAIGIGNHSGRSE